MDKIYSRPRLRIPKGVSQFGKQIPEKKRKRMVKVIFIFIIAFSTVKLILDAVLPVFDTLCESKAKAIATLVSNDQATKVMKDHTYDELFTIEKDTDGNITMIRANVIPINEIISDVPNKIQEEINRQGRSNVEIALGTFTGFRLMAGKGPRGKNYDINHWKRRNRLT